MTCFVVGCSAAAWSVAVVLAVVCTLETEAQHSLLPWLLVALTAGATATLCAAIDRSRALALKYVHAEFEGSVDGSRHLSAI